MKKVINLFLSFFILATSLHGQLAIGEWQAQMAYHNTSMSVPFNNKIYAISEGSLYSYDPEDKDIVTYDLVNYLSDVTITHIANCTSQKTLLIIYDNGNIDFMDENDEVYNLIDLKNKTSVDKNVNYIYIYNEYAYLATNFGIVVINIKKKEITTTYNLNQKVNSCAIHDGYIYAALQDKGLYKGKLTDNLLDINNWEILQTNTFSYIIFFNNTLFGYIPNYAFFSINPINGDITKLLDGKYTYFNLLNEKLAVGSNKKLYLFSSENEYEIIDTEENITNISYGNGLYWISIDNQNLSGYKLNTSNNTFEKNVSSITLNAPKYNLFYQILYHNGNIYSCGGGIYLNRYNNPGTIQKLDNNGVWNVFQDNITDITGKKYNDITSLAIDPNDSEHVFASSAGEGLYEFQKGVFQQLYTPDNSSISSDYRYSNIIRVNGLKYDTNGNLWALCAGATNIISIYTNEKKWLSLYYSSISQLETFRNTFFDKRGWMWCLTPTPVNTGIFILNHNGTLEDTSDDESVYINSFVNQDGTVIEGLNVYCAVEDNEGSIWVGTSKGPLVINNPTRVFNINNFYFTQIKIPRNDGTNYADYLLENVAINAIAIDGANRKWIGTEKNGIYLISADGMEEIQHFTSENSPLLSDEIQSIAINNNTGIIYIGTSKGLITYQSNATQAEDSFSKNKVRSYPNPVKPDYEGYITITGLMLNSNVKITDAYGSLIHEGTSIGGSFSWNGRNSKGKKVASGVYNVLATDSEGKDGIVTKIVVIK